MAFQGSFLNQKPQKRSSILNLADFQLFIFNLSTIINARCECVCHEIAKNLWTDLT